MTTTPNTDASQGDDSSLQAQGATSTSQGDTSTTTTNPPRSVEELERLLAEFKRDNAEYRRKAREREVALQAAEEQRLKEQGEFKQLAEKHEARVKELEPIQEGYTKLAEQINAQIALETKDWPAEVKSLLPDTNVPVEARLEHVAKLRPLIAQLTQQARGQAPGNRPNPSPQGHPSYEDMVAANERDMRRDPRYQGGRIF